MDTNKSDNETSRKDTIGLPEQALESTLGKTIYVYIAHLVNVYTYYV